MKRKTIQLAGKTLVISLPSKWVHKYGIKKGEELDIAEDGRELTVSHGKGKKTSKIKLDLSGLDKMARRLIGAAYKQGYDEIEVTFDKPHLLDSVTQEVEKSLIGYEVIEQGSSYCVIKAISKIEELAFETVLRNIYRTIIQIGEDTIDANTKKDFDRLYNIIIRDKLINRYSDFCRRTLNKFGSANHDKTVSLYHISEELEKIGDHYRDLCKWSVSEKKTMSKHTLEIISKTNDLFKCLYSLHYFFENEELEKLYSLKKEISEISAKAINKCSINEIEALVIIKALSQNIFNLNGAIIMKSL